MIDNAMVIFRKFRVHLGQKKLIMCFLLHAGVPKTARIYSFYPQDTAFILSPCKITYFSVDSALILILLANIFPFFFFVIFFYLNHTALNVLTIRIVRIRPWKSISVSNVC